MGPGDQQKREQLSPRQVELRAFIQQERLARKHEREIQELAWEMHYEAPVLAVPAPIAVPAPVFQPQPSRGKETELVNNRNGWDTFMRSDNTRDGNINNNDNNSGGGIQNDLKTTIQEQQQQSISSCLYEGPPDMEEEEEPIYSTIKKKMTSPTPSFKRSTIHQMIHVAPSSTADDAAADDVANVLTGTSTSTLQPPPPYNHENKCETMKKILAAQSRLQEENEMCSFFYIESNTSAKSQMDAASTAPVPIIPLGTYAESAWLEFGDEEMNIVGKSRSLPFDLHVPQDCKTSVFHLKIEKVPVKKGFSLGLVCDASAPRCELDTDTDADMDAGPASASVLHSQLQDCTYFTIKRGETKRMFLTWTPTAAGGVCEVAYLKLQRGRVRVTARGNAKAAETKKIVRPKSKKSSRSTCARSRTSNSSLSAIKETFKPKVNTFVTSSSIVGNDYISVQKGVPSTVEFGSNVDQIQRSWEEYNDDWAVQQCEAYAKWLNHMFQCPEIQETQCDQHSAVTLRTILSTRRWAQASQRAQGYFNCAEMQRMMQAIDKEVCSKRLGIRSDHNVFANVNLRGQLVSLIMSYTTPWLKLGLETMFGESITAVSSAKRNVCSFDSNNQQKVRGEHLCF